MVIALCGNVSLIPSRSRLWVSSSVKANFNCVSLPDVSDGLGQRLRECQSGGLEYFLKVVSSSDHFPSSRRG